MDVTLLEEVALESSGLSSNDRRTKRTRVSVSDKGKRKLLKARRRSGTKKYPRGSLLFFVKFCVM